MWPTDFFDRGLLQYPNNKALIMPVPGTADTISVTYAELAIRSNRLANSLCAQDIADDARVAILGPNTIEVLEIELGLWRAGKIWVPMNARSALAEFEYIVNHCQVQVLFFHQLFTAMAEQLRSRCPSLKLLIGYGGPVAAEWAVPYDELLQGQSELPPRVSRSDDDLVAIFYTGGTTGKPKGVMHTARNWEVLAATMLYCMQLQSDDVVMHVAPLTHGTAAFVLPIFAVGGTNMVLAKPDPALVLRTIQEFGVTATFLPPTAIYMLLDHEDIRKYNYSSLRHFVYGAAPMNTTRLKEAMAVFGPVMEQVFGQSEAPAVITFLSKEDHIRAVAESNDTRLRSCGRETFLCSVRVMRENGELREPGEKGEIVVRSGLVMKGYWNDPEQTAAVSAHGWHHTGDIGYMDQEGYLYIVDRAKDMIISGGFNIYSSEVEEALSSHPAVSQCAVIGVPDPKWGEAVKGIVLLKPAATVAVEELLAHARGILGSVKAPKSIEVWDTLPTSPVGKVLKKEIRARYWTGQDRMV